jgi:hypothetical protein
MLSLITTIDSKKTKEPSLMELFTATGKFILYCPVLKCMYLHLANKFLQTNKATGKLKKVFF